VSVSVANQSPVVTTSGGTTSFVASSTPPSTPVAIDTSLTVADADNATLAGATALISGNFQSGQDVLAFTNNGSTMGNVAGSYNAATGVLTLTSAGAGATLAQWQAALRSVSYTNTAAAPNTSNRTVGFTVNDGTQNSTVATKVVSVTAAAPALPTTASGNGGGGIVLASVSTTPAGCGFSNAAFVPLSGAAAATAPANLTFPYGLVNMTVSGSCGNGAAARIALTFPTNVPANAQLWKYGKTAAAPADHWYQLTSASNALVIAGNTATYTVNDGGNGDDDLAVNGSITDPVALAVLAAVAESVATPIPTLQTWGTALLSMLLAGAALFGWRRRNRDM